MQPEKNRLAPLSLGAALRDAAAVGCRRRALARVAKLSACLFALLACGDERPPWSGFELFPGDAGAIQLSPEIESGLRAAGAAFLAQLAAGQGASALDSGAGAAGAAAAAGAANARERVDPQKRESEGGMSMGASGHASAGGSTHRASSAVDAGPSMTQSAGRSPSDPARQTPAHDAGASPAGAGGQAGAAVSGDAGTGGQAGAAASGDAGPVGTAGASGDPTPPEQLDAGTREPDADGGV